MAVVKAMCLALSACFMLSALLIRPSDQITSSECYDDENDCFHTENPDCTNKARYWGSKSKTVDEIPCQDWNQTTPHISKHRSLPGNACRDPAGGDYAWCYTTDPKQERMYCFNDCKGSGCYDYEYDCYHREKIECSFNTRYRGSKSKTLDGIPCQDWDTDKPHINKYKALHGNACGDPKGGEYAWCYTTDPDTEWQYCFQDCKAGAGLLRVHEPIWDSEWDNSSIQPVQFRLGFK